MPMFIERLRPLLEPSPGVRLAFELLCYLAFMILTVAQHLLLDYFFVLYSKQLIWYAWLAGDILLVIMMLFFLIMAMKDNHKTFLENPNEDAKLRYAFVVWLFYSCLLVAKIIVAMVEFKTKFDTSELLGPHAFKLILSGSALIFLLLILSHHHTTLQSPRQQFLTYLCGAVTLDLLDSINFLDNLFMPEITDAIHDNLELAILGLSCIGFIMPTMALLHLRYCTTPGWMPLEYEEIYTIMYQAVLNIPYMVIRFWLLKNHGKEVDTSSFLIKNIIALILAIRTFYISMLKRLHAKRDTATQMSVPLNEISEVENEHSSAIEVKS